MPELVVVVQGDIQLLGFPPFMETVHRTACISLRISLSIVIIISYDCKLFCFVCFNIIQFLNCSWKNISHFISNNSSSSHRCCRNCSHLYAQTCLD